MPTTEWLNKYESIKDKLACKTDLDAHFSEKVIGNMGVDVLDIGAVHFPTGTIFACDPLVELNIINLRLDITHLYYPAKNSFQKGRLKRREIFTELLLYTLTT